MKFFQGSKAELFYSGHKLNLLSEPTLRQLEAGLSYVLGTWAKFPIGCSPLCNSTSFN